MLLIPWGDGGKKVYYLPSFAFFLLPLPNLVLSWLNNHTCYFKTQCLCVPLSLCLLVYFLTSSKWLAHLITTCHVVLLYFDCSEVSGFPTFLKGVFLCLNLRPYSTLSIPAFFCFVLFFSQGHAWSMVFVLHFMFLE